MMMDNNATNSRPTLSVTFDYTTPTVDGLVSVETIDRVKARSADVLYTEGLIRVTTDADSSAMEVTFSIDDDNHLGVNVFDTSGVQFISDSVEAVDNFSVRCLTVPIEDAAERIGSCS